MTLRASVIGIVAAGLVLLGNGANAAPVPGAPQGPKRSGGAAAEQPATVVNVYGDNNVIVTDRSAMAVGKDTHLNANSGDVSSSGTLGIDDKNSTLDSGTSTNNTKTAPASNARTRPRYTPSPQTGSSPQEPAAGAPTADRSPFPSPGKGQGMAISGYEDHSVNVSGEDQIAVYDDSNLFVDRNGQVNANTGDTDSSGMNAVDVSGSTVRSGNHIEDGENGDDDERVRQDPQPQEAPTGQAAAPNGSGTESGPKGQSSGTVTDEGESSATGASATTIGADGYDDLGAGLHGKRNIVAYDDSNVVLGGTGKTNTQIGDSDTSGTVVMGIHDSHIESGNST